MAKLDLTSFDASLQTIYDESKINRLSYENHVALAWLAKREDFTGDELKMFLIYGNPSGRSASFSVAQANKGPGKYKAFTLTRARDYGLVSIDNETIEASQGNAAAFLDAKTAEIDGIFSGLSNSLSGAIFRDGTGYIGQIFAEPAETTSTVVTLKNVNDVVHFNVGSVYTAYSAKTGGTQRNTNGTITDLTLAAIDRDAGTLTFSNAYNSSGTLAANDYLFAKGDEDAKVSGFEAWLPSSAPGATLFFGVDRSIDPVRLGGVRFSATGLSKEEALIKCASRLHREGANPDTCFMGTGEYTNLELELGSRVQRIEQKMGNIGFNGLQVSTPKGVIKVFSDASCPSTNAYMLQKDTWKLCGLGKMPKFLGGDGLKMLRETDADAVEIRAGYRGQLGCNAPGFNANIIW